ncbi:hypothetical protein KY284_029965 [Solanum tuberosum]|nr:hypothetical protein KY284_029965 [Solanum tuberosum]
MGEGTTSSRITKVRSSFGKDSGPPMTSPRVQLSDGRYVAYKEGGVAKEKAKHKIIIAHGFDSSKDLMLPISQA